MYLDSFRLPIEEEDRLISNRMVENGGPYGYIDNIYPCWIFKDKGLYQLDFKAITILYGGNGSGKSTLLNLIASKLQLNRIAPYNSSELYDRYVDLCRYELGFDDEGFRHKIPDGSRIITSDDVFDYMLTVRSNNMELGEQIEDGKEEHAKLKYGDTIKFSSMDDYENVRMQIMARSRTLSRRQFIRRTAGKEIKLNSNGETALSYFETKIKSERLYCLDEPENSMSPKMQFQLKDLLEDMSKNCGCQFIIATNSPFILSIDGAKIYDLDANPVDIKNWWELENSKEYYNFFVQHKELFEKGN